MRIIWSAQARADLRAIREYIAHDSAHYADLTVQRIIERVEVAARSPTSGHRVHEFPEQPLREVHQGNHRIIYRISRRTFEVVTVVHFRQRLPAGRVK